MSINGGDGWHLTESMGARLDGDQKSFDNLLQKTHDALKIYRAPKLCPATVMCKKVHKISFLRLKRQFSRRQATPTSFSIFDSYDMKSLWFKFGHDIFTGFKIASL